MWVLFITNTNTQKRGDCIWSENDDEGQDIIDSGVAVRATGPDGLSIYDDTPERVIEQFRQEATHRFATPKVRTKKVRLEQ